MEYKNETEIALDIKLDETISKIRNEVLDIYYAVEDGKTQTADKKLKNIEKIIIDFACGDPFDILHEDLQKARKEVGQKRKESRSQNAKNTH